MTTEEQVAAAILGLPPRLRAVFIMAAVEGRPLDEVAATLRISRRCVDRRFVKALVACRERLEEAQCGSRS